VTLPTATAPHARPAAPATGAGDARPAEPAAAFSRPALLTRLTGLPTGRWRSVLGPASVWVPLVLTLLAGLLRFWNLDHPDKLLFDETYYVKDGWSLLHFGYEREWPKEIDEKFAQGLATPSAGPEYVVHPPLGKWLIAWGMAIFGTDHGLGWRAASATFGTLTVLVTTLVAQRLFRSVALAALAGLFMAVDGQQVVLSRVSILDIFLGFFVILSFYLVLVDRDSGRRRLALAIAANAEANGGVPSRGFMERGPRLGWRPWRLVLGVSLGALCSIKWSGIAFVAVFCLLVVWWDCQARRTAGIRRWLSAGILRDGIPAFFYTIPTALVTYLITWTGWFLHPGAYGHGATKDVTGFFALIPEPLRDLWRYHVTAYTFHNGLTSPHPAASNPWTWLFAGRPVLIQYDTAEKHGVPCSPGGDCIQVMTDLPNPILWWAGTAAIVVVLWAFLGRRDWRALAILSGVLAGYIPWLFFPLRTGFIFYTTGYQPFMVLAVVYVLGLIAGRPSDPPRRRRTGLVIVLGFAALVVLVSWWFWPVWTGSTITPFEYRLRLWLPSWG
jgi:dolichyl-phosphate-mannose-protein mannosyltransferase